MLRASFVAASSSPSMRFLSSIKAPMPEASRSCPHACIVLVVNAQKPPNPATAPRARREVRQQLAKPIAVNLDRHRAERSAIGDGELGWRRRQIETARPRLSAPFGDIEDSEDRIDKKRRV